MTPALLFGGSETERISILGAVSTPRSETVIVSTFFFLAFIVLDNVVNLGSFNRKSHVTIAGKGIARVSRPPSTSRVT